MNQTTETNPPEIKIPLWAPVTLAFILLIIAWTTLIIIAKNNPAEFIQPEQPIAQHNKAE